MAIGTEHVSMVTRAFVTTNQIIAYVRASSIIFSAFVNLCVYKKETLEKKSLKKHKLFLFLKKRRLLLQIFENNLL